MPHRPRYVDIFHEPRHRKCRLGEETGQEKGHTEPHNHAWHAQCFASATAKQAGCQVSQDRLVQASTLGG